MCCWCTFLLSSCFVRADLVSDICPTVLEKQDGYWSQQRSQITILRSLIKERKFGKWVRLPLYFYSHDFSEFIWCRATKLQFIKINFWTILKYCVWNVHIVTYLGVTPKFGPQSPSTTHESDDSMDLAGQFHSVPLPSLDIQRLSNSSKKPQQHNGERIGYLV